MNQLVYAHSTDIVPRHTSTGSVIVYLPIAKPDEIKVKGEVVDVAPAHLLVHGVAYAEGQTDETGRRIVAWRHLITSDYEWCIGIRWTRDYRFKSARALVKAGLLKRVDEDHYEVVRPLHGKLPMIILADPRLNAAEKVAWAVIGFIGNNNHNGKLPWPSAMAKPLNRDTEQVKSYVDKQVSLGFIERTGVSYDTRYRMRRVTEYYTDQQLAASLRETVVAFGMWAMKARQAAVERLKVEKATAIANLKAEEARQLQAGTQAAQVASWVASETTRVETQVQTLRRKVFRKAASRMELDMLGMQNDPDWMQANERRIGALQLAWP